MSERGDATAKPCSILLVDDDAVFRDRLARALRAAGHAVRTAANYDDALRCAGTQARDCAVLDVRMPGRSGLDLAHALRALCRRRRFFSSRVCGKLASQAPWRRRGSRTCASLSMPIRCSKLWGYHSAQRWVFLQPVFRAPYAMCYAVSDSPGIGCIGGVVDRFGRTVVPVRPASRGHRAPRPSPRVHLRVRTPKPPIPSIRPAPRQVPRRRLRPPSRLGRAELGSRQGWFRAATLAKWCG
jgi:hypothetical protein